MILSLLMCLVRAQCSQREEALSCTHRVCSIGGTSHSSSFMSRTALLTAARRLSPSCSPSRSCSSHSTSPSHASRSVRSAASTASCMASSQLRWSVSSSHACTHMCREQSITCMHSCILLLPYSFLMYSDLIDAALKSLQAFIPHNDNRVAQTD